MNETTKTLRLLTDEELRYLTGRGIDIGCGPDPVRPDVVRFDIEHGDANRITAFVNEPEGFDYVFSSHCLEHMSDADGAIQEWWKLLKPGGVMVVIVPDEDLYEQGYWPSLFNPDHKFTFTISKDASWSPVSRNLATMMQQLPGADPISLRCQDHGYEHAWLARRAWPRLAARAAIRLRNSVVRRLPAARAPLRRLFLALRLPIDQTEGGATAQNLLIVAKRGGSLLRPPVELTASQRTRPSMPSRRAAAAAIDAGRMDASTSTAVRSSAMVARSVSFAQYAPASTFAKARLRANATGVPTAFAR